MKFTLNASQTMQQHGDTRVLSFINGSHTKGEHHGIRNRCTGSRDSRYRHNETDLDPVAH